MLFSFLRLQGSETGRSIRQNRGVPSVSFIDKGVDMDRDVYGQIAAMAELQHGVVARSDIVAAGISMRAVIRLVEAGRLVAPTHGVYVVAGTPDTTRREMAIAVLSVPQLAAISHDTAAEVWGLTSRGIRSIHVVTRRWDRVRRPGVVMHESLDLLRGDVVTRDGLPVTSPQRTVVDLGATSRWLVEQALESAIRLNLVTLHDVQAVVDRVARRGRRGVGVIKPLLEARRFWDSKSESALEDRFLRLVGEAGLPRPAAQFVVRNATDRFVCRADFAYPNDRVLIELDSEAHHMDRVAFRRDRSKQNQAMVLGWTVLRFTWWDVTQDPYGVAALVRETVSTRRSG